MTQTSPFGRVCRAALAVTLQLFAAACRDSSRNSTEPPVRTVVDTVTTIRVLQGNGFRLNPGGPGEVVVVSVIDRDGYPRAGAHVAWSVTAGGGTVTPLDTVTIYDGLARALWTLGPDLGSNVLRASSAGASVTVQAEAAAPLIATSIAPGLQHSCALAAGGAAYCWGDNTAGTLGHGITTHDTLSRIPERVVTNFAFSALASGAYHTCGLSLAGDAICWGLWYPSVPTQIPGGLHFVALTTGNTHTCGLTADGSAYCWGTNEQAQLGSGTPNTGVPVRVAAAPPFVSISAGKWFTCGLTADGRVFCWGSNENGALGAAASDTCSVEQFDNETGALLDPRVIQCSYRAIQANLNSRVTQIAAGPLSACASTVERTVICWGFLPGPYTVVGATGLTGIALDYEAACGLDAAGNAWCWKFDLEGPPWNSKPELVPGGIRFAALFAGWGSLCGTSAGESAAYCWGFNERGQLGDGTVGGSYRSVPVPVVSPATP